jgi:fido (protein-threonine AMPylation protein)
MIEPFDADERATPLKPEERNGLIPTHITLRSELNELEQQNIGAADRWAFARRRKVLDEGFLCGLHRRMFNRVWRWAGKYRKTERNLGIASHPTSTLCTPPTTMILDRSSLLLDHEEQPAAPQG